MNPILEAAICPLCGQGYCGRPCLRDPLKRNALLFKRDGTEKTLRERGLGWDDPPLKLSVTKPSRAKLVAVPKLKDIAKGVNAKPDKPANALLTAPANAANNPTNKAEPANGPKDRKAYQRELMRKRRAAIKAAKVVEFKG